MLRLGLLLTLCATLQVAVFAEARMFTIDGHTMVKVRAFCHQFNAFADYDAPTNTYSVTRNGHTVYLIPYCTTAWIDDNPVDLKYVPLIVDDSLYVPLRFMCRAFDLNCTWGPGFTQVLIIDIFTHQQVNWIRDDGWAARQHVWQYPATYRIPQRPQLPPRQAFHGVPLPPSNHSGHNVPSLPPTNHGGHRLPPGAQGQPSYTGPGGTTPNNQNTNQGNSPRGNANNGNYSGNASHGNNGNSGNTSHGNRGNGASSGTSSRGNSGNRNNDKDQKR